MRPIDSEECGGSLEAEARTLPEGTAGYNLCPLSNHPQAESSGSRRPSIEDNPAPDEGEANMSGSGSLPPEFLQWMKDSHTATQEQFKQQAEDRKAADQRHQGALKAMEETMRNERAEMQEAMEKMQNKSDEALKEALQDIAKQGHASTAAVIAGMHTTGDGTAFKDLVKLEKTYTDPDVLRQFCLWENSAVDHMEAMGKRVLQARRRALSKKNPNYAPGMHPDTGGDHPEYLKWIDAKEQQRVKDLYHDVMVVPPHPGALRNQYLARVCRDPEGDN